MRAKFHHLTWDDRIRIETLRREGASVKRIAGHIGVHCNTIYNELLRGRYEHKNTDRTYKTSYSPAIAEQKYRANLAAKGAQLKIGTDYALAVYIERKIIDDKFSPAAVLGEIKNKWLAFAVTIKSPHTIYNYIDKNVFLNLTNDNLPVRGKKVHHPRHIKPLRSRAPKGDSIEKTPKVNFEAD
jgi:IS30 family transposase